MRCKASNNKEQALPKGPFNANHRTIVPFPGDYADRPKANFSHLFGGVLLFFRQKGDKGGFGRKNSGVQEGGSLRGSTRGSIALLPTCSTLKSIPYYCVTRSGVAQTLLVVVYHGIDLITRVIYQPIRTLSRSAVKMYIFFWSSIDGFQVE
jgi:hypothetical protein